MAELLETKSLLWQTIHIILILLISFRTCSGGYNECEPMRSSVCEQMPYNYTILPNLLDDKSQDDAIVAISQFSPLMKVECSPQLVPFLCIIYLPVCTILEQPIPPCRKLCNDVRAGCESIMNEFGFKWPPIFNCEKFPTRGLCVGENYTSSDGSSSGFPIASSIIPTPKFVTSRPVRPGSEETDHTGVNELPVFLILSSAHKILLYDMSTGDLITLQSGLDQGAAIDYHYSKQWIYWASHGDSRIYRGSLTLDVLRDVQLLVDAVSATIESIAVDWVTNHIFWLESYPSQMRVATLDGKNPTTLLSDGLSNPKSLVSDPIEGYLFWIGWVGTLYSPSASIERYDVNRSRHDVIFNITKEILPNMGRPMGLATDHPNKRLYWVDAKSESVQSVTYDGGDFRILVRSRLRAGIQNQNFLSEPRSIAIFGHTMFWSDRATQSIVKTHTDGHSRIELLETLTASPPLDLKVFHAFIQPKGVPKYKINLIPQTDSSQRPSYSVIMFVIASVLVYLSS